MTNSVKIRIAAATTALFIAALSATGVAVRGTHQPQAPGPAPAAAAPSTHTALSQAAGADDRGEAGDE